MKVCVLGSINMDKVVGCHNMPQVGETILAHTFKKVGGGKGANQAVASRRMGCEVSMIGKIGNDADGEILLSALEKDGIDTRYILKDEKNPTGIAIILVDNNGNNSIAVVSGSNMAITREDLHSAFDCIMESDVLISQFETPVDITIEAFKKAHNHNVITLLNPAPAREIPDELLAHTDIIVPNETEAKELTGIEVFDLESCKKAAESFLSRGVKYAIITLGEKGAAIVSREFEKLIPANKVCAIDTTAAGDSFIGGLSRVLSMEKNLECTTIEKAVKFANKLSAIVVTREGAQTSIPHHHEVISLYGEE